MMKSWDREQLNAEANLNYASLSPAELEARTLEEVAVRGRLLALRLGTLGAELDHEDRLFAMAYPIDWLEPPIVSLEALVEWAVI